MLELANDWVWDFWLAQDGDEYHIFFLCAPKSLTDPERRHLNARIGHAVSSDLRRWTQLPDALVADPQSAFDNVATWTGSVVRHPGGTWYMFYTGISTRQGAHGHGFSQRIGLATSPDLRTWTKLAANPILTADSRWYALAPDDSPVGEDFRDPWVFRDPGGAGWHMFVTAGIAPDRFQDGQVDGGVVAHATSDDLVSWRLGPPVTPPGSGFAHLEVTQVEVVDGRAALMFSCLPPRLAPWRRQMTPASGVWTAAGEGPLGPFDMANATAVTDDSFYVGRMVRDPAGRWVMLAFHNLAEDGSFPGVISDPMPLEWRADRLVRAVP